MFVVFDFDGTLSDHRHRLHLVAGEGVKNYPRYYDLAVDDLAHMQVIKIFYALQIAGHRVEIWTGRTDRVKQGALDWLLNKGVHPRHLTRMRVEGDFTPDTVLKKRWLDEEPTPPDLVFEDRPRMVKFWREQGIMCCDVGGESE